MNCATVLSSKIQLLDWNMILTDIQDDKTQIEAKKKLDKASLNFPQRNQ